LGEGYVKKGVNVPKQRAWGKKVGGDKKKFPYSKRKLGVPDRDTHKGHSPVPGGKSEHGTR